jgi:hypothetical protein
VTSTRTPGWGTFGISELDSWPGRVNPPKVEIFLARKSLISDIPGFPAGGRGPKLTFSQCILLYTKGGDGYDDNKVPIFLPYKQIFIFYKRGPTSKNFKF